MAFGNFVCLHMLNFIRATVKLGQDTPRASKSIHKFANKAAFLIRFHRASDKYYIADRVKMLVRPTRIDVFTVLGAVGINEVTRNFASSRKKSSLFAGKRGNSGFEVKM